MPTANKAASATPANLPKVFLPIKDVMVLSL